MSVTMHAASAEECQRLWPAVDSERLFSSAEELAASHAAAPWSVRVTRNGIASVLGAWRSDLSVLAMRGVWCAERHVPAVCADAYDVALERGYTQLLSPLLPVDLLGGYVRAGMRICQRVVAIQVVPSFVIPAAPPGDVRVRLAHASDLDAIVELDASSFEPFWRYGEADLRELLGSERAVVAQEESGELIGYTLATVSRGAATLGRLAVSQKARRRGIGRALVADVAEWATSERAMTLGLCTQEENAASRALYAQCGLREIDDRYGLAIGDVGESS